MKLSCQLGCIPRPTCTGSKGKSIAHVLGQVHRTRCEVLTGLEAKGVNFHQTVQLHSVSATNFLWRPTDLAWVTEQRATAPDTRKVVSACTTTKPTYLKNVRDALLEETLTIDLRHIRTNIKAWHYLGTFIVHVHSIVVFIIQVVVQVIFTSSGRCSRKGPLGRGCLDVVSRRLNS